MRHSPISRYPGDLGVFSVIVSRVAQALIMMGIALLSVASGAEPLLRVVELTSEVLALPFLGIQSVLDEGRHNPDTISLGFLNIDSIKRV